MSKSTEEIVNKSTGEVLPASAQIPAGFEKVSDGELAKEHEWKTDPICTGLVLTTRTVKIKRGRVLQDNRLITVETDKGIHAVWESAGLTDLFNAVVPGDEVYIEFLGEIDLGKGTNPMKKFATGLKRTGTRVRVET